MGHLVVRSRVPLPRRSASRNGSCRPVWNVMLVAYNTLIFYGEYRTTYRSVASRIVKLVRPQTASRSAADRPAIPAPIITTLGSGLQGSTMQSCMVHSLYVSFGSLHLFSCAFLDMHLTNLWSILWYLDSMKWQLK